MITALPLLALSLGLISSLHCMGMCGPIALAVPVYLSGLWGRFASLLLYNIGRAISYAWLGMLVSVAGLSLTWLGIFRYVSVATGVVMLAYLFWPAFLNRFFQTPAWWRKWIGWLRNAMSHRIKSHSLASRILLGMLNGMVPCGLVYVALLSSVATGNVAGGGTFMFLYGLGTMPAMMAVSMTRELFKPAFRTKARKLAPLMLGVAACLLIIRGLTIELPAGHSSAHHTTICR